LIRLNLQSGLLIGGFACGVFFCPSVSADAIIRSEAMFASTIVEMSADEAGLTIDLEIGLNDLNAFRNLLPDGIYTELGFQPEPLAERLRHFSAQDFVVGVDGGERLQARIVAMGPEERVRRDSITGEPLASKEGEQETVVRARLFYAFEKRPDSITFGVGAIVGGAGIGYVFYHKGIAVNDFRYMTRAQTVDLDWHDPWYTAFNTRALRRQNFAPMSGFIYVEPYEVRKEVILRPKDLQHWIDLDLEGRGTICTATANMPMRRSRAKSR